VPDGNSEESGYQIRAADDATSLADELFGASVRNLHDDNQRPRTTIMLSTRRQVGPTYQVGTNVEVSKRS